MSELPAGDDAIRATVTRLARPHARGAVVERAAILAEGEAARAIMTWILDHDGQPETTTRAAPSRGLHSARGAAEAATLRYVLPADALT